MKLTLDSLAEIGAFTGAPVEKEISWRIGDAEHTATVYVRPLSYHSAIADLRSISTNQDAVASRIASSIVDEEGKPVFTAEDITGDADPERGPMHGNIVMALLTVIGEVNGLGKTES